jgi:hypothetical protein
MSRAAEEMQRVLRLLEKPADLLPEERARLLTLFQALVDNLRTEAWQVGQELRKDKGRTKGNPLCDRVFEVVDSRMAKQKRVS